MTFYCFLSLNIFTPIARFFMDLVYVIAVVVKVCRGRTGEGILVLKVMV